MDSKFNLISNKLSIFLIFLLVNIFKKIKSLYFNYPTAITLNNGNIFIIHENGFTICNSLYSHIISYPYNFTSSEKINDEIDLSHVTISQFEDGYIFCIVIKQIFIFNSIGEFKQKEQLNYIDSDDIDEDDDLIYILEPHKILEQYYYYLVATINHNTLHLAYFKYYPLNNMISIIDSKHLYEGNFETDYTIMNDGLSCKFVLIDNEEIILCFYHTIQDLDFHLQEFTTAFFYIENNIIKFLDIHGHYTWYNNRVIKSINTPNPEITIFSLLDATGYSVYFNYSYENSDSISIARLGENCTDEYYSLKLNYFKETKNILLVV